MIPNLICILNQFSHSQYFSKTINGDSATFANPTKNNLTSWKSWLNLLPCVDLNSAPFIEFWHRWCFLQRKGQRVFVKLSAIYKKKTCIVCTVLHGENKTHAYIRRYVSACVYTKYETRRHMFKGHVCLKKCFAFT